MATSIASKRDLAVLEPDPSASRGKVARLTPGGRSAQDGCDRLLAAIEDGWQERFGSVGVRRLRRALDRLTAAPGGQPSPLWLGLGPLPRRLAGVGPQVADAAALPHGAAPRRLPRRQLNGPGPVSRWC